MAKRVHVTLRYTADLATALRKATHHEPILAVDPERW